MARAPTVAAVFVCLTLLAVLVPQLRAQTSTSAQPSETPPAAHPKPARSEAPSRAALVVTVIDENKVAVSGAQVILSDSAGQVVSRGETDYAGRSELQGLGRASVQLRVAKEGFYEVIRPGVRVGETESVEVTLNHQQEFTESLNVIYSPPAIDPEKTTSSQALTSDEIINVPYPVPRDIRYALPLLPGVLMDSIGQLHVDGSNTAEIVDQLDGFNITDSGTGQFDMRVSVDAIRSVDVQRSRYPAEFGKGSGGLIDLTTGMGDDRLRFSGTDFLPSVQGQGGLHISGWTPRGTVSGPLDKGKAWFLLAPEGEYDVNVFQDLPPGADRSTVWRFGNLAKTQVNWRPAQVLTGTLLINQFGSPETGLSRFNPVETTVDTRVSAYLLAAKNQSLLSNGVLIEVGFGASQFRVTADPRGDQTYVITPEATSGNYFEAAARTAARKQFIANLILPPVRKLGRHQVNVGADLDRITSHESFNRHPFEILREDGTLGREVSFIGNPSFERDNFESSAYAQDRWSPSDRALIEAGVRLDRDEIVRQSLVSPRLASSLMLTRDGNTKLTAGAGIYYDASMLDFISRPLTGQRLDTFYDPTGQSVVGPPLITSFALGSNRIGEPRIFSWSVALDRKLPASIYLITEFIEKREHDGWTYLSQPAATPDQLSGRFAFSNTRRDRYDALEVTARRRFKGDHILFGSYTRSSARSNAVLDFNLDNPVFSQQVGGPLAWDAPNRFQSWGIVPLVRKFDFAYSTDWRDGYPFFLVNQNQQLVAPPGVRRFPAYFTLNTFLERRLLFLGNQWALRMGFDNVTNRHNPTAVNNNVDSPQFLTLGGLEGRAVTAEIRLLGRK